MFHTHSISRRIAIGKIIGLIVGLAVMLLLPLFNISIISMFGIGSLMMFVLMGAFIGFMGIFDRHPVLDFKMPWWVRGSMVGAIFMLMYILLTYETIALIMQSKLVSWMGLTSPFWAILDGVFIGGLMGLIETKFAGEGKTLPVS